MALLGAATWLSACSVVNPFDEIQPDQETSGNSVLLFAAG